MKRAKLFVCTLAASVAAVLAAATGQDALERLLRNGFEPPDYFPDGEPAYVPLRNRNSLPEFQRFIEHNGWSTNQLLQGLMFAVTNNATDANWADEAKRKTAGVAAWKLGEIDDPAVTNFFRQFNDSDDTDRLKIETVSPMFLRTNLEPEVLDYMRTLCVRTNIYSKIEAVVLLDMLETLDTMPDEFKASGTNRVAKFMYFSIGNTTVRIGVQDRLLAGFLPSYSNSIQRLSVMRYVSTSATNAWERSNASQVVQYLESLPTNQLNDISWIAGE